MMQELKNIVIALIVGLMVLGAIIAVAAVVRLLLALVGG